MAAIAQNDPRAWPSVHAARHYAEWLRQEAATHEKARAEALYNAATVLDLLSSECARLQLELASQSAETTDVQEAAGAEVQQPAQVLEGPPPGYLPVPEDEHERRVFDTATKTYGGDVRATINLALRQIAALYPRSSFAEFCKIMANEVLGLSRGFGPRQAAPMDAQTWLRARYGAYRGHPAWRELEEAFNAGCHAALPGIAMEESASKAL